MENKHQYNIINSQRKISWIGLQSDNHPTPSTQRHPSHFDKMGSSESATAVEAIDDIEDLHRQAILDKQSTYIDPSTGFTVFTELTHLKRGKCCGNQCRHCVYGWSNVKNGNNSSTTTTNARVRSGDKEGARRLVKRILEGTYYDDVDGHHHTTTEQVEDNGHEKNRNQTCNTSNVNNVTDSNSVP